MKSIKYILIAACLTFCSCETVRQDSLVDVERINEYNRFLDNSSHAISKRILTVVYGVGGSFDSRQYIAFRNVGGPLTVFDGKRLIEVPEGIEDPTYIADQLRTGVVFAWFED